MDDGGLRWPRWPRCRLAATGAATAFAASAGLLFGSPATAQDAGPGRTADPADTATAGPATEAATEADELRYPLIREGSRLVQVRGLVDRDPRTRGLRLTIDETDPQSPGHRLILVPSSRLTELEMLLGAAADVRATMIVTGRVLVFEGRNYLLLTHPAVPDERLRLDPATPPPGITLEAGADADPAAGDGDSVDDIARDLERSVGSVGRRTPRDRGTDGNVSGVADAMNLATLVPEGTRLVDRRGKIRRTEGGGFMIVFDADASGESDPPMMLLPCRLLEGLARIAAGAGDDSAVLISGEVTIHAGRNFLLPTVYRVPRELTQLHP
jgi:hypothetical protein